MTRQLEPINLKCIGCDAKAERMFVLHVVIGRDRTARFVLPMCPTCGVRGIVPPTMHPLAAFNDCTLSRAESFPPQQWEWFRCPEGGLQIGCPKCGRAVALPLGGIHSVEPDGSLKPSFVCPHDGCGMHAFLRLEGWAPADQGGPGAGDHEAPPVR